MVGRNDRLRGIGYRTRAGPGCSGASDPAGFCSGRPLCDRGHDGDQGQQARLMVSCLQTYRTVAKLFPNDRLFYDAPIKELLGGESQLHWYRFTKEGKLVQRESLISVHEFNGLCIMQPFGESC